MDKDELLALVGLIAIIKLEKINGEILSESDQQANEIAQTTLFETEEVQTGSSPKPNVYGFDFYWRHYPKKAGKKKTEEMWAREVKDEPSAVIRIWNCLYFYLKEVRDERRKGFDRAFQHGDRFFRNREDWIGYTDTLITGMAEAITRVVGVLEQLKNEANINQQVAQQQAVQQPVQPVGPVEFYDMEDKW